MHNLMHHLSSPVSQPKICTHRKDYSQIKPACTSCTDITLRKYSLSGICLVNGTGKEEKEKNKENLHLRITDTAVKWLSCSLLVY